MSDDLNIVCATGYSEACLEVAENANLFGLIERPPDEWTVVGMDVNTGKHAPLLLCRGYAWATALCALLNDAIGVAEKEQAQERLQRFVDSVNGLNN